jgi:hypothetical protein
MTDDGWPELMSGAMAAQRLGVSTQRVSQMVQEGVLERALDKKGRLKITAESVRRRLANPPRNPWARNPASVGTADSRRHARRVTETRRREEAARIEAGSRQLLTYAEVRERLGVTAPRALRRLFETGQLERIMLNPNHGRVPVESVELFEARRNFL